MEEMKDLKVGIAATGITVDAQSPARVTGAWTFAAESRWKSTISSLRAARERVGYRNRVRSARAEACVRNEEAIRIFFARERMSHQGLWQKSCGCWLRFGDSGFCLRASCFRLEACTRAPWSREAGCRPAFDRHDPIQ